MGSSLPSPISPEFLAAFSEAARPEDTLTFAQFMTLALYHPQLGYYRRPKNRVGYGPASDFFTATTSGPLFGELVCAACVALLGPRPARDFTFVEIGAETPAGILQDVAHPFASARTVRLGETLNLQGKCIVFSNELFDAQPFHRYFFRAGAWREVGVGRQKDLLVEIELPTATPATLPRHAPEGYRIDAPLAATTLAAEIVAQPWSGLFLAFDYGKSWLELVEATPMGTARAYRRHTQSNDLLADPGQQDLTCHICWDWLADTLRGAGFPSVHLESQEAFLIHHAGPFIAQTTASEAAHFSRKKLSLLQLLHPSHLGQKFQVLHGYRSAKFPLASPSSGPLLPTL